MRRGLLWAAMLVAAPLPAAAQTPPAPATIAVMATSLHVSDLDRSLAFYTKGLGMVVATRMQRGTGAEVILSFETQPALQASAAGIILLADPAPGKPPLELGNGFAQIVLRVGDVAALAARLTAAGYPAGEIRAAGPVKILKIKDPDGYSYEIVELPAHR